MNSLVCINALSMWAAATAQQLDCALFHQTTTAESHGRPLGIDFPPPEPDHFRMGPPTCYQGEVWVSFAQESFPSFINRTVHATQWLYPPSQKAPSGRAGMNAKRVSTVALAKVDLTVVFLSFPMPATWTVLMIDFLGKKVVIDN
jgi:hypothetical protein